VQLMTKREVLQFQNRPATEPAGNGGDDGTHILKHAGDTTSRLRKTLYFWPLSEFLVATGGPTPERADHSGVW
jgi:hypothetical protein